MVVLQAQHRDDPHRRLLRHTYQEGPDFLFLATRGGRPPVRPPDTGLAEVRLRARCVRVAREEGIGAALELAASRASLYRWRTRYEAGGLEALRDRLRGPAPSRLPAWVEQAVIVVRLLTYWNSKRLAAEFSRREIYPLDHHAVDALLADLGTARPSSRREKGPAYERGRPNELWHIDIKGPFFLRRSAHEYEKTWIVGLVDDHSRFLIGLRILPRPQAAPILAWLDDCFELCGTPLELMSDNGNPFVVWMPGVLTLFGKTLEELRIRHLRTQVNSPWTNGKIERFWGVLQAEVLDREVFRTIEAAADGLARFAAYYNHDRLHGELGWHTPAEQFDGTPFTARGFERIPALDHLNGWLTELMTACGRVSSSPGTTSSRSACDPASGCGSPTGPSRSVLGERGARPSTDTRGEYHQRTVMASRRRPR